MENGWSGARGAPAASLAEAETRRGRGNAESLFTEEEDASGRRRKRGVAEKRNVLSTESGANGPNGQGDASRVSRRYVRVSPSLFVGRSLNLSLMQFCGNGQGIEAG